MKAINNGEYGLVIYFDLEEDVSSNTNQIEIKDPDGNESIKTATLGTTTITGTEIGTLTANQYVTYQLADGDIDEDGRWMVRAVSTGGGKKRKTNWQPLVVKA